MGEAVGRPAAMGEKAPGLGELGGRALRICWLGGGGEWAESGEERESEDFQGFGGEAELGRKTPSTAQGGSCTSNPGKGPKVQGQRFTRFR